MSCFRQPTAINGKNASEEIYIKNVRALGPNENLLHAVTIKAKVQRNTSGVALTVLDTIDKKKPPAKFYQKEDAIPCNVM